MRLGKCVAQGAHASLKVILDQMLSVSGGGSTYDIKVLKLEQNSALQAWVNGSFAKITVSVNSEQELLEIYEKAQAAGIISALIQDAGKTEFHGVPTYTTCAIGPDYAEKIDLITGNLKLY